MKLRAGLIAAACALVPVIASAQALVSLASLRVAYNTRKTTVQPQGELKTRVDALDREIAEATRLGRTAELRRLFSKGFTVLAGREWTDTADYAASLVIRSERVVVDSSKPYVVRLEQIYNPSIQLERALKAHLELRTRPTIAAPGGDPPPPPQVVKDLGASDGIGRDLRDAPSVFEINLQGVADGSYQLAIDVSDDTRALGSATLFISVHKGLDDLVARLEAAARTAPAALRDDILYPVDRMKQVNRGRLEIRTFNPGRDFATAEAVAAAAKSGKNPFTGRTGDFKRAYLLEPASEIMPYRLYVPTTYSPSRTFPLIVALHGLGATEDSFFTGYDREMTRLAERHGYIVAAPLGYRVDGSYGWGVGNPPVDPTARRVQENSENDVMQVLQRVRQQYHIDDNRIYLMGHSMGAIGTWKIAAKFPDIWASLGMFAGTGTPATLDRVKHVPEFVVHGDADATVNVQGSRSMVAKAKELGTTVIYIEVPGGSHLNVVAPNLPAMFDFFNAQKKKSPPK